MYSKCQTSEEKAEVPPMTNATWYGGQALVPSVCLGMKNVGCATQSTPTSVTNQSHGENWPKRHRQIGKICLALQRSSKIFKDLQKSSSCFWCSIGSPQFFFDEGLQLLGIQQRLGHGMASIVALAASSCALVCWYR